ncbi:MAG: DUF4386 domain-containing protein [Acidimicrobiia bacterium]|nr:DUF4386 domain-containing protein [Acidimicrobiia bacterium]
MIIAEQWGVSRRTATIVGTLFLVALVPFLIGGAVYGPATGSDEFLQQAYPDRGLVILGILIEFVAVAAIPLIGVFMFPVLRRFGEALALAYVAFRSLEAVLLISGQAKVLSLIDLSDRYLNGGADGSHVELIGNSLLAEKDQLFTLYVLVFTIGAMIFYAVLYRSRLIPRWLSGWGLLAAAWMLVGTVLIVFDTFSGTSESVLQAVFVIPLPLNEIALALWLIVKGFDQDTLASLAPDADQLTADSVG